MGNACAHGFLNATDASSVASTALHGRAMCDASKTYCKAQACAGHLAGIEQYDDCCDVVMQAGVLQATPLDVPELHDLEPLLVNLPDSSTDAQGAAKQQQLPRTQRYPELHFLRAMLQLQQALQRVRSCQQPMQAQDQDHMGNGAFMGDIPQQQAALLQTAYADLRQPVQELLLDGLAPAALRLPLLVLIAPLLESPHTPFTKADVQGLLRVMQSVNSGLPAIAAAVLDGSSMPGVSWPVKLSDPVGPKASAVSAARLALFRGLARADVTEHSSVQAW